MSIGVHISMADPEVRNGTIHVGTKDGGTSIMRVDARRAETYVDLQGERALARLTGVHPWPVLLADAVEVLSEAWPDPRTKRPAGWDNADIWRRAIRQIDDRSGTHLYDGHEHASAVLLAVHPDIDVWQRLVSLVVIHGDEVFPLAVAEMRRRQPGADVSLLANEERRLVPLGGKTMLSFPRRPLTAGGFAGVST